jgi:addiction module RelE/StbE family toxin
MARLIWTRHALEDLERLLEYIAKDAPVAACRFAEKIIDRVEMLETHPLLGGWLPEDDRSIYRQLIHGNYPIIYRLESDVVYLVAVHHVPPGF